MSGPVFVDQSGRRWRHIRRAALVTGVATTLMALVVAIGLIVPPLIPELHPESVLPKAKPATSRMQRLRNELRRQFQSQLSKHGRPLAGRRPGTVPIVPVNGGKAPSAGKPIVAGFYVKWDDNSFESLKQNIAKLDLVVLEWAFVDAGTKGHPGGDSLTIVGNDDRRVIERVEAEPREKRPRLYIMVSNFSTSQQDFTGPVLRRLLTRPAARAKAIAQLVHAVDTFGLEGVVVDFEVGGTSFAELPALSLQFTRELKAALASRGKKVGYAIPAYATDAELRQVASVADHLYVMLFDEHYSQSDPGPIASQEFYDRRARQIAAVVPPEKLILMIGAYGYDWNDQPPEPGKPKTAEERTYQDVMTAMRDSAATLQMDSASLNPFLTYTSPDSTDHVVWFLDGLTAYNEYAVARSIGAAGSAIWRLGGEDPSFWRTLKDEGDDDPAALSDVPPGYYPEIQGDGEILRVRTRPTSGKRTVRIDKRTGLVTDEAFTSFPSPFIVQRYGAQQTHPHWVALTFDDGPDATWTPMILDTLRSRGVPATFFVIGQNADAHIRILKRTFAEGHEIGNHTYTHPNLGMASRIVTRMEIDGTERLIEAVLNHRTALFRAPYFGDAEPTTVGEDEPAWFASNRGYLNVGLHVDSEDWRETSAQKIIANVLDSRPYPEAPLDKAVCRDTLGRRDTNACNVILLHDGGGSRAATVAALGPLIDSLRARGDTIVLVSRLAGLTRDEAMPPLEALGQARRVLEAGAFYLLGATEWLLFWVFAIAVVLGIGRLVFIGALAVIQRLRLHQNRKLPTSFAPPVSVIIPAYNEEKVITRTIQSLLDQHYNAEIEVVVVDDGSTDATYAEARRSFDGHDRVSVYTKPNGGKASALNFGIARARHDIVVCLDADTLFACDTIAELVQPLAEPSIGAVAGNARVGNRINIVTRWQALEYVTSQNLDRRAFSLLDCITVVPGAVGAWRRAAVQHVGGFREDTLAEDQDLTLALRRAGHSVAYADGAVAYTEAPDTFKSLAKQRFRWSFGTLQCAWKHRDALFRRKFGSLGWVALPNVWLFQLLLPAISPIADLMFVWSLISVWMAREEHGATYALTNLEHVMLYYAVFLLVDWLAAVIAFVMEPDEDRQLTWLIFLQRFAYRQLMYWVVLRSFAAALRGHVVGWGKLERKATVEIGAAGARS
jgi:peptidoglycan-N-acetylglucosamine deacetylase